MTARDAWVMAAGWFAGTGSTLAVTSGPTVVWAVATVAAVVCAIIGARCER